MSGADLSEQFDVQWIDHGREPQCASDPAFPRGKDLDVTIDGMPRCAISLPYPAKRCGAYYIECDRCGARVIVTTAGRPDDPRSVAFPCKVTVQ